MTDKRFTIIADYPNELGIEDKISGDVVVLTHRNLNSESFVNQVCYLLNELAEENQENLKERINILGRVIDCQNARMELHKENKEVKSKICELIEYYRNEEINADDLEYERICSAKQSVLHELMTETNNGELLE